MFFCEACKEKNNWPESISRSRGPCELCKTTAVCYDVASKFLPLPKERRANPNLRKPDLEDYVRNDTRIT